MVWSFQPGAAVPTWLLRVINSGLYTFGGCSLFHLAAVSVVKCTVIVRPLTHFTIFTDRGLRSVICAIWIWSLLVAVVANVGVIEAQFSWIIHNVGRQAGMDSRTACSRPRSRPVIKNTLKSTYFQCHNDYIMFSVLIAQ